MNMDFTNSLTIEKLIAREFSSVSNKSDYKDFESKFEKITEENIKKDENILQLKISC